MAVNRLMIILCIGMCICYSYADTTKSSDNVNNFLSKKIENTLAKLAEKIEYCTKQEQISTLTISANNLQKENITVEDFKIATTALNYRNYRHCIEDEENTFLYYNLLQYSESMKQNVVDEEMLNAILMSLPSHEILEALSRYEVLPKKIKEYFEERIGLEPFDIVKTSLPVFKSFRK